MNPNSLNYWEGRERSGDKSVQKIFQILSDNWLRTTEVAKVVGMSPNKVLEILKYLSHTNRADLKIDGDGRKRGYAWRLQNER